MQPDEKGRPGGDGLNLSTTSKVPDWLPRFREFLRTVRPTTSPGTVRRPGCPCGCAPDTSCVTDLTRHHNIVSAFCACSSLGRDQLERGHGCERHALRPELRIDGAA